MYSEKEYFSIGEVSKLKKVTIKALRYYHEIGLLVPSYIDAENGYRYYTSNQFNYIDIIKTCRSLGVSIKELLTMFSNQDPLYLSQFMSKKCLEIKEKIQELEENHTVLETLTKKIEVSQALIKIEEFEVQYFPKRYAITVPIQQLDAHEAVMGYLKLDEKLEDYGFGTKFEHGIYYKLSTVGDWKPTNMFELVETDNKQNLNLMKIPTGYYLTYCFSNENEEHKFKELRDYLSEKGLTPEFMLAFELYNGVIKSDKHFYQIQAYIGKIGLSSK